ncbi:hypothetical protein B566_EDAN006973 [Ephemera danica]|nr:hypothetical protein B566_EDAN006973 [Ephemera danica]
MAYAAASLISRRAVTAENCLSKARIYLLPTRRFETTATKMMEELEHLKQGSQHPPLKKGSMRIYNMRFCPYAQRSLLVAEAKRFPYDIINVDLSDKPDWFLKLNPRGLVPTIEYEDGSHLPESLIMCDYLDEKYPERPLYPKDPLLKARERILIDRFNEASDGKFA